MLVFEDLQWADAALLDFIDYLLEWSRDSRSSCSRWRGPSCTSAGRPGARAAHFTSLYLEPLPATAMESSSTGLVPGLPDELAQQILERAEGMPLYAVETVRMLLDRGAARAGRPASTGPPATIEALEVPETLHALDRRASRRARRRTSGALLQDAAVLGQDVHQPALAALSRARPRRGRAAARRRSSRKEVLAVQADPRSPERGQYGFLQDLLRTVAYETLSKRERKARHLAAPRTCESALRARRRRSSRCSPRTTSRRYRGRSRRGRRRRDPGAGARDAPRAGERARLARGRARGAALLRAGGRARRRRRHGRRSPGPRRPDGGAARQGRRIVERSSTGPTRPSMPPG